ncbi:MAG: 30S ribosomal protein S20 [Candidatus Babeliaceae bacterium]|nr:30S ribosomal protein S20 [Candidatus Babeliaceae bacterium]
MANTKSAKKNIRKNEKRRLVNIARQTALKTAVKKVSAALETGAKKLSLDELLSSAASQLGRAKGKGTIHANAAARKISRLAKKVAQAQRSTGA